MLTHCSCETWSLIYKVPVPHWKWSADRKCDLKMQLQASAVAGQQKTKILPWCIREDGSICCLQKLARSGCKLLGYRFWPCMGVFAAFRSLLGTYAGGKESLANVPGDCRWNRRIEHREMIFVAVDWIGTYVHVQVVVFSQGGWKSVHTCSDSIRKTLLIQNKP